MNKAHFMLPGFCEHYKLYTIILDVIKKNPEFLRENADIYCIYGNIPFCTWDGGRIFPQYPTGYTVEQMQEMCHIYNDIFNIKVRFVFTNGLITEKDCYDRYNNLVLNIFNNGKNEIVVNSPVLEKYISENYPNYTLISSTTKCITNNEQVKEEINKSQYKFVCLDYNLNHNEKLFQSLTPEEKSKVELLINPICGPGCQQRKEHYRLNSLFSLNYGKPYSLRDCSIPNGKGAFYPKNWLTIVEPDELYSTYLSNDFHNFKLEGRTFPSINVLLLFAKYLIKPEFQFHFISVVNSLYNSY